MTIDTYEIKIMLSNIPSIFALIISDYFVIKYIKMLDIFKLQIRCIIVSEYN